MIKATMWILLLLLSVLTLLAPYLSGIDGAASPNVGQSSAMAATSFLDDSKCQRLQIPFCEGVDYNDTIFPNILNHGNQQEASQEINIYWPLLKVNCSRDIQIFLCSVFAPICYSEIEHLPIVQPCRSLCESARSGCEDLMKKFGFPWPPHLACDRFPDYNVDKLCVGRPNYTNQSNQGQQLDATMHNRLASQDGPMAAMTPSNATIGANQRDLEFQCPENFKTPTGYDSHVIQLNGKTYKNCGIPCDNVLLNREDTTILRQFIGLAAFVTLAATSFTCATFLFLSKRFRYPERVIIIISFCNLFVAICYIIGFFMDDELACSEPFAPPKSITNIKMIRTVTRGNKKPACTSLFMALYFFDTATSFWFLMLGISWFMSAGLIWATEAIERVSNMFHIVTWSISGLLTTTLLAMGEIEGDVMSGVCYVGFWKKDYIWLFVVLPKLLCLTVGLVLILASFVLLSKTRKILNQEGTKTDKLEKLTLKILTFTFLFTILYSIQLISIKHEYENLNSWLTAWQLNICKSREYSIPCPSKLITQPMTPHYSTFLLKYVSVLSIGMVSCAVNWCKFKIRI